MYGYHYDRCQNCSKQLRRRQRRFCSVKCRDDKGPCGAESCTRPAHSGGLCHTHYRAHRTATRKLAARLRYFRGVCEREWCEQMWRGFLPNQRFCSPRCARKQAEREENERRWAKEAEARHALDSGVLSCACGDLACGYPQQLRQRSLDHAQR
jgi:hypothetical protein